MGALGHYNFIEYIPYANVIMDNSSYFGKCEYWYGQIDDNCKLKTLCQASMPLNDENELYLQTAHFYINEDEVSEKEYNNFLEDLCSDEFIVWCGESNQYSLDVLNQYSINELRAGRIEVEKMKHNYLNHQ